MALFQKSILRKFLEDDKSTAYRQAYKKFIAYFGDAGRIENIINLKEENYQEGFLRELFVNILGYTLNPEPGYNLTTEYRNPNDARKADGAILKGGKPIAVIELKSTKIKSPRGIVDQAIIYKSHHKGCRYMITSTFEKLYFYIDDATEYEEFTLFDREALQCTMSESEFRKLYFCLSKESIMAGIPAKMKESSKKEEEDVTEKLYRDYSLFKDKIFDNLLRNNSKYDKLTLFKKSQKLLDRMLFIYFAEDKGLVPPNTIERIIARFRNLAEEDEYSPLYSSFRKYFKYLDEGNSKRKIPAYNGELFKPDKILDDIELDDHVLLADSLKLSKYNFDSEVDVNILGHIFEHSLNAIEEMQAELAGEKFDKKQSKRKKHGIFYTPKYITKYIVENTVGALCNDKKEELGLTGFSIEDVPGSRKRKKLTKKQQQSLDKLLAYREYLLSLKILDPACGSGAFLNQALEYLMEEHRFVDENRRILEGDSLGVYDIETSILENNLYGVDLNEEAVEIAKLSLWLRTARSGRKLTNLSGHIKCGNSLIDDPDVAGDKAFKWEEEFPDILNSGGFDVVIGNPPYVNSIIHQQYYPVEREWLRNKYLYLKEKWDMYLAFVERSLKLCKAHGLISMIIPDAFLTEKYADKMRDYLLKTFKLRQIDHFPNISVFKNVGVHNVILTVNNAPFFGEVCKIKHYDLNGGLEKKVVNDIEYAYRDYDQKDFATGVMESFTLGDICFISVGLVLNANENKFKGEFKKEDLISDVLTETKRRKIIEGKHIKRFCIDKHKYVEWDTERVPGKIRRPTFRDLHQANKLLVNKVGNLKASFDDEGYICDQTIRILIFWNQLKGVNAKSIKNSISKFSSYGRPELERISQLYEYLFLLAMINSKYCQFTFDILRGKSSLDINPLILRKLPIPKIPLSDQQPFIEKADMMLEMNKELSKLTSGFITTLQDKTGLEKVPKKLQKFYMLEYAEFLKELKKKKIIIPLRENSEWREYFIETAAEINALQARIDSTDAEIDQMVYKLYGLTEEEIKIVEENV